VEFSTASYDEVAIRTLLTGRDDHYNPFYENGKPEKYIEPETEELRNRMDELFKSEDKQVEDVANQLCEKEIIN
jgi:hypothetical protein